MPMQNPEELELDLEEITTCSSIMQLSDATDIENSYMLVSQPDERWNTYSSRKSPLSVIGKTIISSSDHKIEIISGNFDMISSLLSDALEQDGKSICVNTNVGSPYIISSIYERHGTILSIDGYSLSDQIQISTVNFQSARDIAYLSVGKQEYTISIPDEPVPTTHICTFTSGCVAVPSQTRSVVLHINVMSQETYNILCANTQLDDQRHFIPIEEGNNSLSSFELYLTTEDEIEPDPDMEDVAFFATEGILRAQGDQDEQENQENPEETNSSSQQPASQDPDSTSQQTTTRDVTIDDNGMLIGTDIHDFDDVTFLDVQPYADETATSPDVVQSPEGTPTDGTTTTDGTSTDGTSTNETTPTDGTSTDENTPSDGTDGSGD